MTTWCTFEQRGKSLQERFWEKVDKGPHPKGCWLWTSAVGGSQSYGLFWVGGHKRTKYAHRLSWEMENNTEATSGKVIMHSCDNPRCVNPAHLSLGEHLDNKLDSVSKKRHAFGSRNGGGVKLNDQTAAEILSLKGKRSCIKVGQEYGVSKPVVLGIWKGRLWRHVCPQP